MTQMIKRFFLRFKSAEDIASDYSSYTDFAKHATSLEKERLMEDVIYHANQAQRNIAAAAEVQS